MIAAGSDRVKDDPRLSKAQQQSIKAAAMKDGKAKVVGLDARMRPVVEARLPGPRQRTRYALLRNGEPTRVTEPLAEVWR